MMKERIIILFIGIIFIINGCDLLTEPKTKNHIMPLAVGNYWIYDVIGYEDNKNKDSDSTWTLSIEKVIDINNTSWYVDESNTIMFKNKEDGLWDRPVVGPWLTSQLLMKYPGMPGDKWTRANYIVVDVHIESTGYHININNESFTCYVYHYIIRDNLRTVYYATPSIGIVKIQLYDIEDDTSVLKSELILSDYNIR